MYSYSKYDSELESFYDSIDSNYASNIEKVNNNNNI